MEISEVRRRLLLAIDQAKREGAARRARLDAATRAYEAFLTRVATPVLRMMAGALAAEGRPFKMFSPAGSLRLASVRSPDDFIELTLDTSADPPVVLGRVNTGRGRRVVTSERPVREGVAVDQLTDEDVLRFLLEGLKPFLER